MEKAFQFAVEAQAAGAQGLALDPWGPQDPFRVLTPKRHPRLQPYSITQRPVLAAAWYDVSCPHSGPQEEHLCILLFDKFRR